MKSLIWKEWREHLKWVLLPGLVILLVFSIEKPEEPMPGDGRVLLLPDRRRLRRGARLSADRLRSARRQAFAALAPAALSPSRIFLAKAARRRQPLPAGAGDSFCLSGNLEGEAGQHAGALSLAD